MIRVTVCIPHLMREDLLRRCLWALRNNVRLPYHVIIINDGKRPLSFADGRIRVINNLERRGLGAARQQFAELVETEFLFTLDNDIIIRPGSLEMQIEALDRNPQLAAVSGLGFDRGIFYSGVADFEIVGDKIVKQYYNLKQILASKGDLFKADFIPISHTTFRMEAVKNIEFDPAYKIGYDHWDIFMQLYHTDWKCAVHKRSRFEHLKHESTRKYFGERERKILLEASRRHFIQKWGYRPVDPREWRVRRVLSRMRSRLRRLTGRRDYPFPPID